jgi:uroporphyrin-III C-methyltransferase/precorrin-2 dehydrogenase/sirohydrochlorin ferrochelatase
MDRLAILPLFFPLNDRRAVVIGGSEAAAWKAELLSAAGASVAVLDPEPGLDMVTLAADPPGGSLHLVRRCWLPSDLGGAALVVAAAEDEAEAQAIYQRHRQAGVLQLPIRRRRQPLATGRWHLNRRSGPGVRAGHPIAH